MKPFYTFCLLFLWFTTGCVPAQIALPTTVAVAVVPSLTPLPPATLPSTYTPQPTATATQTPTPTLPSTDTATPPPTETPSPTPFVVPDFLLTEYEPAPYLAAPPSSVPCGDEGLLFQSRFPSTLSGPTRSYHAYLPPCYGLDGRSYPVLYLIHGSIQTDSHWADLGLAKLLDQAIQQKRYPPFIAIMPYSDTWGNITSGGPRSIEAITVDELIPYIDSHYCTWAVQDGRQIGGISRGGYWALMIAFRHPDLFTAVAGHSSHLRPETDSATYNPLSTYATADLSHLHIWLDWGERDFLRTGQQKLDQLLTEANIPHDTHIFGGNHSDAYWAVHLQEYLDWHASFWPITDRDLYPPCP